MFRAFLMIFSAFSAFPVQSYTRARCVSIITFHLWSSSNSISATLLIWSEHLLLLENFLCFCSKPHSFSMSKCFPCGHQHQDFSSKSVQLHNAQSTSPFLCYPSCRKKVQSRSLRWLCDTELSWNVLRGTG